MQLKNKAQREAFLDNYKSWELWKEIPELEVKLYRYAFISTGAVIIATEHPSMKFVGWNSGRLSYKKSVSVKYHLMLSEKETFNTEYREHRGLYNPTGESKSMIIDYLTKVKPEV